MENISMVIDSLSSKGFSFSKDTEETEDYEEKEMDEKEIEQGIDDSGLKRRQASSSSGEKTVVQRGRTLSKSNDQPRKKADSIESEATEIVESETKGKEISAAEKKWLKCIKEQNRRREGRDLYKKISNALGIKEDPKGLDLINILDAAIEYLRKKKRSCIPSSTWKNSSQMNSHGSCSSPRINYDRVGSHNTSLINDRIGRRLSLDLNDGNEVDLGILFSPAHGFSPRSSMENYILQRPFPGFTPQGAYTPTNFFTAVVDSPRGADILQSLIESPKGSTVNPYFFKM